MTINEINTLLESAEFTDFLVPLKAVFQVPVRSSGRLFLQQIKMKDC